MVEDRHASGPPRLTSVQISSAFELALFIAALLFVIALKRMTFWLIVILLEHWLANRK